MRGKRVDHEQKAHESALHAAIELVHRRQRGRILSAIFGPEHRGAHQGESLAEDAALLDKYKRKPYNENR